MIKKLVLGVLALAGLVVLLAGVPWLLLTVGHYPTITGWPTWQQLQVLFLTPDNGQLLLIAATIVCWLVWLYLAAGFVVELVAALRHIPAPQLPGFALPQLAAKTLITTVALLFASLPLANAGQAVAQPLPQHAGAAPAQAPAPQEKQAATGHHQRYTVKAGDTLSEIAHKRLGNADRWSDIYQASKHLPRPDGTRFTDPDLLQPGQTLIIPSTTSKASSIRYTVKDGDTLANIAERRLGNAEQWSEIYRASKHLPRPDGTRFTDPDLILPGQTLIIPKASNKADKAKADKTTEQRTDTTRPVDKQPTVTTPAPTATPSVVAPTTVNASPTATASAEPAPQQATVTAGEEHSPLWSASLGVGSILAGGVIGLVAWRRRLQHRRGPIGGHVPLPADDDALAEQQLRAAADPLAIETVDQALRGLARDCGAASVPLPVVRAARLTADQFELYLDAPAQLPAPWTGTADAAVWRFEADHEPDLDVDDLHTIPAPYPSLVTIGKDTEDEAGLIFVDLEYVGSLGVTGGRPLTRQVIAALAIELASSPWADDLTVTIVGDYADLEGTLRSGRIVYVPTAERLIDKLERRAVADREAFAAAGVPDLQTARAIGGVPDASFPEIVLIATPLTARQRQRLTDLVSGMPRVAIAAVTTDTVLLGDWHLHLTGDDQAVLNPIGLTITPQMLSGDAYDKVCAIIHMATHEEATVDVAEQPIYSVTDEALDQVTATDDDDWTDEAVDQVVDEHDAVDQPADDPAAETAGDGDPAEAVEITEQAAIDVPVEEADVVEPVAIADVDEHQVDSDSSATEIPEGPSADDVDEQPPATSASAQAVEDPGSSDDAGDDDPEATDRAVQELVEQAAAVVAAVGEQHAPYIRVLGPTPDLDNARGEADITGRRDVSLEAIVYMALHPQASTASLDRALWPDSDNPSSTRAPALSRARRWLGTNDQGDPYLAHHTYRLSDQVTTDWARFQQLAGPSVEKAATKDLEAALELVTGRPFSGVRTQSRSPRYTWAEPVRQRMIEAITSVSYELAQRRFLRGDWLGVEAALVVGIEVEPALEHLGRLRIRAAVKRGDGACVQEAITRMTVLAEKLGVELDPHTEELLKAIRHTKILEKTR